MARHTRMKFRSVSVIGMTALILSGLLAGCSGGETNPKPSAGDTNPAPPLVQPQHHNEETNVTPPKPAYTAPLTGLPSQREVTNRPFAVMINNLKPARPQSGLPHADVVWEVLAEGGITRLVAIFQSDDSFTGPIGPIRSIRPYLIQIGESYGGVLVHSGASNDALALLQHSGKADMDEINNASAYFYRDKSRKAPHNLYSTLSKLQEGASKRHYDRDVKVPAFSFAEDGATGGGTPAEKVAIHFLLKSYRVSYTYDPATKLYARFINGEPHTDLTTNTQLTTANIAVIGAKHRTYDDYGRLDIDLDSGGPAMLIQLGKAVQCEWKRGADGAIHLMKDGRELSMVPGKTYYHVVPMTPTFAGHIEIT
ncbi:DUF3048 domain-containing protein [Paenibacillus humicola]|uniref:DUF3048 domain-containing protein n=1 Tax=Paenibacillus humicola TaxID=3110540 RepID=UPI00237A0BDD|nr:DUF3048 domain-containing protein [Paenibacillus humicola]